MEENIQVITATEKKETAKKIARVCLEKRLAACIQILGPVNSTYWWKGKLEEAEEWLCFMKTKKNLFNKLEACIKELHPYETPEIIALPIVRGSKDYLKWLGSEFKTERCTE